MLQVRNDFRQPAVEFILATGICAGIHKNECTILLMWRVGDRLLQPLQIQATFLQTAPISGRDKCSLTLTFKKGQITARRCHSLFSSDCPLCIPD
jgi:hypothetical protein